MRLNCTYLVICDLKVLWFSAVNFEHPESGLCIIWPHHIIPLKRNNSVLVHQGIWEKLWQNVFQFYNSNVNNTFPPKNYFNLFMIFNTIMQACRPILWTHLTTDGYMSMNCILRVWDDGLVACLELSCVCNNDNDAKIQKIRQTAFKL